MATLSNGLNGGFSGKLGNIIGYQAYGRTIIRSAPKKRTKKPSAKEQLNRYKFAMMQAWLQPLLGFLRVGFKNYAPSFQGFLAAKSYNSKHAFSQREDGSWFIDPALALVSFGQQLLPQTLHMQVVEDHIEVNWSTEGHYVGIDCAMLLAYAPEMGQASYDLAAAKRNNGSARLAMPAVPLGTEVHVYLSFVAYDHSERSNSRYLGRIVR